MSLICDPKERPSLHYSVMFLVLLMASLTRFVYFKDFQYNPLSYGFNVLTDSIHFFIGGQNFASGDILASSPSNRFSPLYSYFLGFLFKLFGSQLNVVWLVQFSLGVLTVLLVYLTSRDLFGLRSAVLASILYNFYGPAIMYEGVVLRASLLTFLGILSLYLILKVLKKPQPFLIFASGLSISLFIQCRPNVALIFAVLPVAYVFPLNRDKLYLVVKIILVAVLFFFPLLIRSWVVHGKFVFFDYSGPVALLIGNSPEYSGWGSTIDYEHPNGLEMEYGEMLSILLDRITEQPLQMLGLYIRKLYYFFSVMEPFSNYDFFWFAKFSPFLNNPLSNLTIISSLVLTGAFFKIGREEKAKPLWAFIIGGLLAILIFSIISRFRVPIVPILAIYAGYTLNIMFGRAEQRQWQVSAKMTLLALFFIILFNIPGLNRETHQKYSGALLIHTGLNLVSNEQYSQAIGPLNQFLKENQNDISALRALALAYSEVGDERRSSLIHQKIFQLSPEDAGSHYNLANIIADNKEWRKAFKHMSLAERYFKDNENIYWMAKSKAQAINFSKRESVFRDYYYAESFSSRKKDVSQRINLSLGVYLFNNKQYPQAIQAFERQIKNYPELDDIHSKLALAYLKVGKKNLAINTLERLVAFRPNLASAHFNLANLYANLNIWEKAIFHMKFSESLFLKQGQVHSANLARDQVNKLYKMNLH